MKDWPWYGHVVIAVVIFGMFFLLYYRPKNNELENISSERIRTENEVKILKQKEKELQAIEKELIAMNIKLNQLETIIPQKEEIDIILRRIQELAYDSRINIREFISKPLIDKEYFSEKPINMKISGSYHNLATFFNQLANFSRLFNIENFKITALRDQSDFSTISATTTAKTYIFREPPPPEEKQQSNTGRNK
jgi:Tfp pilus assembly protein PilO